MPHIHTAPGQHDLTASGFIVDVSGDEPRVWLHTHKLLHIWLQFGGHVELDENPWQAICHEIPEESGFDMSQLKILQPKERMKLLNTTQQIPQPFVINSHRFKEGSDHFHTDIAFAFTTREEPTHTVAAGESGKLHRLTRQQIETADESVIHPNTQRICLYVIDTLLGSWEPVDPAEFNR